MIFANLNNRQQAALANTDNYFKLHYKGANELYFLDYYTTNGLHTNITGLNFEVAPGQAEFQIMNVGIDAADELHMARYILIRTAEQKDLYIDFHPKPFKTKLNGSGCHTNYSTKQMREDGGMEVINNALSKLKDKHTEHISVYGKD